MNKLQILNKNEKEQIIYLLNKQFGINSLERAGLYFAKFFIDRQGNKQIRLSIEGTQILSKQFKKNIFELNKQQATKWMQGQELNIKTGKKGFLIMKYKDNYLGTGKASQEKIGNFIPKSRRLKSKSIIN
jgi:NOL1/NOP2/fmu family ribosome biogenesis protein